MTRATLTPERIEALTLAAGSAGLRSKDFKAQLLAHLTPTIYRALATAQAKGLVVVEKKHPIALYFHASVDEATRKASFAQQLPQHRSERAQAVREGTKAGMQARRSGKASSAPQRTAKPPPKAVDPQALQPTATVSDPAGLLQKPECVRFLTRFERLAAEKAPPLPPDPPSTWALAVIESRITPARTEAA